MDRKYSAHKENGIHIYSDHGHHVEVLRMPRNISHYTGAFGERVISWHWFLATSFRHRHIHLHMPLVPDLTNATVYQTFAIVFLQHTL
jgi:hypothetical protein